MATCGGAQSTNHSAPHFAFSSRACAHKISFSYQRLICSSFCGPRSSLSNDSRTISSIRPVVPFRSRVSQHGPPYNCQLATSGLRGNSPRGPNFTELGVYGVGTLQISAALVHVPSAWVAIWMRAHRPSVLCHGLPLNIFSALRCTRFLLFSSSSASTCCYDSYSLTSSLGRRYLLLPVASHRSDNCCCCCWSPVYVVKVYRMSFYTWNAVVGALGSIWEPPSFLPSLLPSSGQPFLQGVPLFVSIRFW